MSQNWGLSECLGGRRQGKHFLYFAHVCTIGNIIPETGRRIKFCLAGDALRRRPVILALAFGVET